MQLEILSMKHFSWIISGVKHHLPTSGLLCYSWATYVTLQKYIKELANEAATTAKQNCRNAHFSCHYIKYHMYVRNGSRMQ